MKVLRELMALVDEKTLRQQLNDREGGSLRQALIELARNPDMTDDDAAKALYGPSADRKLAAYKVLKSRVRDLLIINIHRSKPIRLDYGNYNAAYESGYRQLHTIHLLVVHRAYNAIREIASSTFRSVRKYEIIPLNQKLTNHLAYMYLGVGYNEALYKKYSELNRYYTEAAYVLSKLEHCYREVRDMVYAHRLAFPEIGRVALAYVDAFEEHRVIYRKVSQIQGMIFNLEISGLMYSGRYQEAIESSKRGEAVLNECEGVSSSVMDFLLLSRLESILKAGDFALGTAEIANAEKSLPRNSINGVKVVEYAIRLGLQMGEYDYAYLALANLNRRLINRLLTPQHQQYWMIWEAYVNFLVVAGEITPQDAWPKLPRFKFTKFFNDVPAYSRNKTGMNIPILILQAMYFIVEGKHGKVIDRTEALERYCTRYLKNDENLRNNCFFRLLLLTVQVNFNRDAAERKAIPVLKRMALSTATSSTAANNMEIIPYERLWRIVLRHLGTARKMPERSR